MRKNYLITYDISDDKRRTQVFTTLCDNGNHTQYSVFICELSDIELTNLKARLAALIKANEDQVLILDLGSSEIELSGKLVSIGKRYTTPQKIFIV